MGEQSWPTSEQFDQAATLGTEKALDEFASGNASAQESPLSGEWAGGLVPRDIAFNVGFKDEDSNFGEALDELAEAWEQAYFSQWNVNYERMAS